MPNYVTNVVTLIGSEEDIKDFFEKIKNDEQGIGTIDFNKIIPMPKDLEIESGSNTMTGSKMVNEYLSDKMFFEKNPHPSLEQELKWLKDYRDYVISHYDQDIEVAEPEVKEKLTEDKEMFEKQWDLGVKAKINTETYGYPTWYEWAINNWGTKWGACGYEHGRIADNKFVFQTAWNPPHPIMTKLSEMFPTIRFIHDWADEDFGQNCGTRDMKNGEFFFFMPQSQKEAYELAAKVFRCDIEDMGLRINATGTNYVWTDLENYELVSLWNKPALFCEERITEDDIPEGFNLYHLRDAYNNTYTIEPHVNVDFAGCIITNETIDFFDQGYLILGQNDFVRLETPEDISFDDFVSERYDFDRFDLDDGMGGMC